jgi:primosomal protein N' (replication factor Y)
MGVKRNHSAAPAASDSGEALPAVEVALALPVWSTFSYTVPIHLASAARPGMRVLVPFGSRRATGYVLGPQSSAPAQPMRAIEDVLDDDPLLPASMLPWLRWMAHYYMHPPGEVIRTALPAGLIDGDVRMAAITDQGLSALEAGRATEPEADLLRRLRQRPMPVRGLYRHLRGVALVSLLERLERAGWLQVHHKLVRGSTRAKMERFVRLHPQADATAEVRSPKQRELLALLGEGLAVALTDLRARLPGAAARVRALAAKGMVTVEERPVFRDPLGEPVAADVPPPLTGAQDRALARIGAALGDGFTAFVLAGITGSGKTEVYLQATAAALARGHNVLVLAPEIALIAQIERRFRARFGASVAVLHSGLSTGERYDQWRFIRRGQSAIAIGARSAVFAPFARLGLIIVDEEHDGAYKQDNGLRYNGRDMALARGQREGAVVVLGSATPSMAAMYALHQGRYRRLELPERIESRPLPQVAVVDLRDHRGGRGTRRFLTPPLVDAMGRALGAGEQVLLFLNRRGFAAFPVCGACGEALRCRRCDIALTLHRARNVYQCHYCGYSQPASIACPHCHSDKIRPLGLGTERIEAAVQALFPQARVARMDRDTVSGRGQLLRLLRRLHERSVDVLVGTQMVAKGHDFPGITLVGIVCADLTLNFPDFRAGERTFQLLAQVAGRAGRGDRPGRVILQTFNPAHFSIQAACAQDMEMFYRREIGLRQALAYPPFSRLAMVRLAGRDPERTAASAALLVAAGRREAAVEGGVEVLGPVPAPLARVADRYRWQILFKGMALKALRRVLGAVQTEIQTGRVPQGVQVAIDVDPQSML